MVVYVWGMGKAGIPLALSMAESGMKVVGIDIDKKRVDELNKGINPIPEEPMVSELLKKHIGKNFTAMTSDDYSKEVEEKKVRKDNLKKQRIR